MYKMDKLKEYILQHREIQPIFYNNYKWSIIFKNCESLCCIPETYKFVNQPYHLYVESKNMIQMKLFTKQKQTHRLRKQTYDYQRGNVVERDKLGVWD